jgi:hypothetical protein
MQFIISFLLITHCLRVVANTALSIKIPCTRIINSTSEYIGIGSDPDWDDQFLTFGKDDNKFNQKILRKLYLLDSLQNITICNKSSFNFAEPNAYMTGIRICNANNPNNDGISLVLGTVAINSNLKITAAYNYSHRLNYLEQSTNSYRINQIIIF